MKLQNLKIQNLKSRTKKDLVFRKQIQTQKNVIKRDKDTNDSLLSDDEGGKDGDDGGGET